MRTGEFLTSQPARLTAQVQNAVSSYQIAQEEGGATLGYWGAVMNMACLGADPSCNIAACRRVDKERKDDECDIDDIGGFQASIFQSLVGNPDFTKIAADAKRYQIKARQFESEMIDNLKKGEDGPGGHTPADYEQIIVNAALGAYDSNFYGTTELGLDVLVHQVGFPSREDCTNKRRWARCTKSTSTTWWARPRRSTI